MLSIKNKVTEIPRNLRNVNDINDYFVYFMQVTKNVCNLYQNNTMYDSEKLFSISLITEGEVWVVILCIQSGTYGHV